MTAEEAAEGLCALTGHLFLDSAYRTLLLRPPDPHGVEFYRRRLALGISKQRVADEIASSSEARKHCASVPGHADLLRAVRALNRWPKRLHRRMQGQTAAANALRFDLELLVERCSAVERSLASVGARTNDDEAVLMLAAGVNPSAAAGARAAHLVFSPRLGPGASRILGRLAA